MSVFGPLSRLVRLVSRFVPGPNRNDPVEPDVPARPPLKVDGPDDVKALVEDLVRDGTARLTDMATASRMFTALQKCQEMFEHPTEPAALEARVAVALALAKARGQPRPALDQLRGPNPAMADAQKILDAMFEILVRCHHGEFKDGLQEALTEWTRGQLRAIGYDVVPMGASHGVIVGRTSEPGGSGRLGIVEPSRRD